MFSRAATLLGENNGGPMPNYLVLDIVEHSDVLGIGTTLVIHNQLLQRIVHVGWQLKGKSEVLHFKQF